MKADLSECIRRLDGAEEDRKALHEELTAWVKAHPQPMTIHPKVQGDIRQAVIYVSSTEPIPALWGRRSAHILYDARSCLDHLVHELYVASNGRRPRKDIASALQFPICDTARAWKAALYSNRAKKKFSRLEGIKPGLIEIVRRYQPYRLRRGKSRHALAGLQRLNNLDKHRRPNVVLFAGDKFELTVECVFGCRVDRVDPLPPRGPLKVGTKLARVYLTPLAPNAAVGVHYKATIQPTLEGRLALAELLADVLQQVRNIVAHCATAI